MLSRPRHPRTLVLVLHGLMQVRCRCRRSGPDVHADAIYPPPPTRVVLLQSEMALSSRDVEIPDASPLSALIGDSHPTGYMA